MSDAEYYLVQAEFCLDWSRKVADFEKVMLLKLACEWAELAEAAGARADPNPALA
jgi:hypothetical protein